MMILENKVYIFFFEGAQGYVEKGGVQEGENILDDWFKVVVRVAHKKILSDQNGKHLKEICFKKKMLWATVFIGRWLKVDMVIIFVISQKEVCKNIFLEYYNIHIRQLNICFIIYEKVYSNYVLVFFIYDTFMRYLCIQTFIHTKNQMINEKNHLI